MLKLTAILIPVPSPEVIDDVLRKGADFYINKGLASAVPVFVNRCYDGDAKSRLFVAKSKTRLYLLNNRYDVRIKVDKTEPLASKVTPKALTDGGAVLLAQGLEQRDREEGEFIFKMRDFFRWREVFVFSDEVEGLGRFIEFQGPDKQTVDEALAHFGLDSEEQLAATYLQMYNELRCPRWLKRLRSFHDKFGEFVWL